MSNEHQNASFLNHYPFTGEAFGKARDLDGINYQKTQKQKQLLL